MLEDNIDLVTVTDLKQYVYCERVFYYHHCLPHIRPTTYKMEAGIKAGEIEKDRSSRRVLPLPNIDGQRYYDVPAHSAQFGLTGNIDEVIEVASPKAMHIPVDYKLSKKAGHHFKIQLAAYAVMLEETYHLPVERGFLYLIPKKKLVEVPITEKLRHQLEMFLQDLREVVSSERMPPPAKYPNQCFSCEFKRFCNDV